VVAKLDADELDQTGEAKQLGDQDLLKLALERARAMPVDKA
jgi:hypothetical protein